MLKCASAYTYEIDNYEVALAEIKAQLDKKITLLKNSVGVIMCHPEFVASGVLRYICENLPFDVAGTTTASQSVNDGAGELMLTVFVMTADDVWFKAGITDEFVDDLDAPIKAAYEKAAKDEPDLPKLALLFPPFLMSRYAGNAYVEVWKKIIPGTPLFGMAAMDDTITFNECRTICNSENKQEAMSFILCYGNINPRFLIATLPPNPSMSLCAEVTKSKDGLVYEINHMTAREFFKDTGIPESMITVPFMIDFKKRNDYDNIPVVYANVAFTEDGAAVFYGYVDEGSTISVASSLPDDILSTSLREIHRINDLQDVNGVLLFPCIIRRMVLLGINEPLLELKLAKDNINPDIPFMMSYAGGEICPTSVISGVPVNRFHNYSLVILVV